MTRWLTPLVLLCLSALGFAGDEEAEKPAPVVDARLSALLDAVQRESRAADPAAIARFFAFDKMARELEKAGYLGFVPAKERTAARNRIAMGLERTFARRRVFLPFDRYQIRSTGKDPTSDVMTVYVWLYDADGNIGKTRWHLVRRADDWAIYDLEDLELGFGVLHLLGAVLIEAIGGIPEAWRGSGGNLARAQVLLLAGEVEEAHALLLELESLALPAALAAIVQMLLGATAMAQGEYDAAIGHLDVVAELGSSAPAQHYFRAAIYNSQGMHEAALRSARRYVEVLDADPMVNLELGIALHGLDRKDAALKALTSGLKESREDTDLLAYYALCLPQARHGELAEHFEALSDKVLGHRDIADVLLMHEDAQLLRLFVGYFRENHPQHYDVAFYEGHAFYIERKFKKAAAQFEVAQKAMFTAPEAERPQDYGVQLTYLDALIDALLALDDPVGAYDRTLDQDYAFDYIADELAYTKKNAPLLRTYLAHAQKFPPDDGGELTPLQIRFYGAEADLLEQRQKDALAGLRALHSAAEEAWTANGDDDAFQDLLWNVEDLFVRTLVGATLLDEALKLATRVRARDEDSLYLAIVHVARGETAEAIKRIEAAVEEGRDAEDIFEDRDMAEALKGSAYVALRKKLLGDG